MLAKAAPDGFTIGVVSNNHVVNPSVYPKMPFDAVKDFTPISQISSAPNTLVVHPSLPITTVRELIAYAKANPAKLNYGSGGNGSAGHLAGEMFKKEAGIFALHIPYNGGNPAQLALLGGQVDIFISVYGAPHVEMDKQGKVKFIAALSPQRQPLIPNVPTVDEGKALKGFHHSIGTGYYVPSGTPEPVVAALNKALAATLGVGASTLSFHLKELSHAGLVSQERDGRNLHYRADLARVRPRGGSGLGMSIADAAVVGSCRAFKRVT